MVKQFGNRFMKALLSSPAYWILGKGMAVITVFGRKTGKEISTPVNVVQNGNHFTVISSRNRTWWRNLRGGAKARLHYEGKDFNVSGIVKEEPEETCIGFSDFFTTNPEWIKLFKLSKNTNGGINTEELKKISNDRVIIQLLIE